ncbi:Serum paraoxonase/arylesterase 2 [Leucoagaricus sp. SymC.cos]|nr:Serum paraoxonase/arylesterase 2 [Leucoagaricus sp. SymC.cos]
MARMVFNALAVLAAIAAAFYQFYLKDVLVLIGYNRVIEPIGNKDCHHIPELRACEKISLHQPSGRLFLACSEPNRRTQWLPAGERLNKAGASQDYVAIYDPTTSKVAKLKFSGVDENFDFSSHGMDVVPSASNPSELFVYLVNHRPPRGLGLDPQETGADSVLEIFQHKLGSNTLTHIKTFESPLIISPNDVVGSDDGTSLYFTNDHGQKLGIARRLDPILKRKSTSVVYCNIKTGCKYAIQNMISNNGIARALNGTLYVAATWPGTISVLEEQSDNTLVITDYIKTEYPMDNLSIDSEGHVWAAAFPKVLKIVGDHFKDPKVACPSTVLRLSVNTGPNAFYGDKYKIEKAFEDDGHVASGSTSAIYDVQRKKLFIHGPLYLVSIGSPNP